MDKPEDDMRNLAEFLTDALVVGLSKRKWRGRLGEVRWRRRVEWGEQVGVLQVGAGRKGVTWTGEPRQAVERVRRWSGLEPLHVLEAQRKMAEAAEAKRQQEAADAKRLKEFRAVPRREAAAPWWQGGVIPKRDRPSVLEAQVDEQLAKAHVRTWIPEYRFAREAVGAGSGFRARLKAQDLRDWRSDYAWPELKLALEVNGAEGHGRHGGKDALSREDEAKFAGYARLGWRVYPIWTSDVPEGRGVARFLAEYPELVLPIEQWTALPEQIGISLVAPNRAFEPFAVVYEDEWFTPKLSLLDFYHAEGWTWTASKGYWYKLHGEGAATALIQMAHQAKDDDDEDDELAGWPE